MDQGHADVILGGTNVAIGSVGLTLQLFTEYANLTVTILNILLALGGLYLMIRKIRRDRRLRLAK